MTDKVIRPSAKFIQAGFLFTLVLVGVAFFIQYQYLKKQPLWLLPGITALLILWPIGRLLRRQFTKLTITGEKLYFEVGALSKQTRIIQIPKIQDVRVSQSIGQRMLGIGDLWIETAGESSRLTVSNIDGPRALADQLLELALHDPSLNPRISPGKDDPPRR